MVEALVSQLVAELPGARLADLVYKIQGPTSSSSSSWIRTPLSVLAECLERMAPPQLSMTPPPPPGFATDLEILAPDLVFLRPRMQWVRNYFASAEGQRALAQWLPILPGATALVDLMERYWQRKMLLGPTLPTGLIIGGGHEAWVPYEYSARYWTPMALAPGQDRFHARVEEATALGLLYPVFPQ